MRVFAAFAIASISICTLKASAQQLDINSMWVADPSVNCVGPVNVNGAQGQFLCSAPPNECSPNGTGCAAPTLAGNISNNPHIEFDQTVNCSGGAVFPSGSINRNICQKQLYLCANIFAQNTQTGATAFAIDSLEFESFVYASGSNPLDPTSTPPLRSFFVDQPGTVPAAFSGVIPLTATCNSAGLSNVPCGVCVLWDGSYNILGGFGRTNGQFGFRATVATNQTGSSGNINITQTRAYPNGATLDSNGTAVSQAPITINVADVHVVRTSATVVGSITGVAAEPYNITYRLSQDSTMYIQIANAGTPAAVIRTLVNGLPRVGEGTPGGSLTNGDAWNGREDNGAMAPPGSYLATLQAVGSDQYGTDLSAPTTMQISLDPLVITDIQVSPLTSQSTSLAVLTYVLTEPATTYIDIYPSGTQFCAGLNSVNNSAIITDQADPNPPKNFAPSLGGCAGSVAVSPVAPIKRIVQQQNFRTPVISFWDGRDLNGNLQPDGDYVFVIYAAMTSQNGFPFRGIAADPRIWTSAAKSGFVPISRGLVGISQIQPITSAIGSSQPVAGLNPVFFDYSLSRDALVSVKIFDSSGLKLKRTLISQQIRPGNFLNQEVWPDGMDDNGNMLPPGNYLVQLNAADPFLPSQMSTTTAIFPLNLFRLVDVNVTQLLTGATDVVALTYQLSQGMNIAWNIYSPGTTVISTGTWPPCGSINPGLCAQTLNSASQPTSPFITVTGMRPGRLKITETWDGRNTNGIFVPDGTYVFTLTAQSTTTPSYFATDKVFGTITIARGSVAFLVFNVKPSIPTLFNSSQTITLPPFQVDYTLTRQSSVTIQILNTNPSPQIVRTVISGQIRDANILNSDFWDGRSDQGNFVPQGFYTVQVLAQDLASTLSSGSTAQQTIAVDPLRIYDVAVRSLLGDPATAGVSYQVSETMKVSIKVYKPGTIFDPNGNPTPPEAVSLIQRFVGVRPSRTQVSETWDGRDLRQTFVPDGNYIFRIIASTDVNSIDTVTGNPVPGASLAEDLIVDDIPVVRGASADPQGEFVQNTFMYPNPVSGSQATFNIFSPFQANVDVKILNLAGELVYEKYFANQPSSITNGSIVFAWPKINSAGKGVAAGVYFVLVREEETLGGGNILQTVKKMVVQ